MNVMTWAATSAHATCRRYRMAARRLFNQRIHQLLLIVAEMTANRQRRQQDAVLIMRMCGSTIWKMKTTIRSLPATRIMNVMTWAATSAHATADRG
jgi:hypothetical protein